MTSRLCLWFRKLTRRSLQPRNPFRRLPAEIGPSARSHMEALREVLRNEEWEMLTRLGTSEFQVRGLREVLRTTRNSGERLAQAATALTHEMDAFLAETTGGLARALHAFPARSAHSGSRAADNTLEFADRVCASGEEIVRAASILGVLRARIEVARLRFGSTVPGIWTTLVDDGIVRQIAHAQSVGTAERLERVTDNVIASLELQHEQLRAASDRMIFALNASPAQIAEWRSATGVNDEAYLALLSQQTQSLAKSLIDEDAVKVVQAADSHLSHIALGTGGAFVRRPVTRLLVPRHPILLRWSELQAVRRRPASVRKSRAKERV